MKMHPCIFCRTPVDADDLKGFEKHLESGECKRFKEAFAKHVTLLQPDTETLFRCSFYMRTETWPYVKRCEEKATHKVDDEVLAWAVKWTDIEYPQFCELHTACVSSSYAMDQVDD